VIPAVYQAIGLHFAQGLGQRAMGDLAQVALQVIESVLALEQPEYHQQLPSPSDKLQNRLGGTRLLVAHAVSFMIPSLRSES